LHQHDYSVAGLLTPGDIMVAISSENILLLKEAVKAHVMQQEAVLASRRAGCGVVLRECDTYGSPLRICSVTKSQLLESTPKLLQIPTHLLA
ncbi:MAG TPA: hypothetical protein PLQ75_10030, partial [Anaerolineales bacterium]|nr:hypothetical protein [Anaerolineales bacterium]